MKQDYNKLMKNQISQLTTKPKLALHVCCAVCASSVVERLLPYFDVTMFYYNPNIMPEVEWELRKAQLDKLVNHFGVKLVVPSQSEEEFLQAVKGLEAEPEGGKRCEVCISLRLDKTFSFASENGFDYVATSLTISPHKNAQYINELGERLSQKHGVNFLYSDFKKEEGFKRSTQLCNELNIYRQTYCGCTFAKK